jgi:hypothetical protein
MLNKSLGMILYPAQFLSFPGINLEFQGFQGFSRTKIKIQGFPGFPGAVRTLDTTNGDILVDIVNCVLRCPSMLSQDGVVVVCQIIHLFHTLSRVWRNSLYSVRYSA